ncbi:MAG: radical SAM protein [Candidatus Omnitrophica bacterium]|nr:radical SAM protein [Candidatus Omnitrophota bacterium]
MKPIIVPRTYDYVGVYLTDKCHLSCCYCITQHHQARFGSYKYSYLKTEDWIKGLNRLVLPEGIPITLQGGEPFLFKGIWKILENVKQKIDIMTALPSFLKREDLIKLKTLDWNKRKALYPTIRVSYHKGQNDYKDLIKRIAELQDILSIGLYYLSEPSQSEEEVSELKSFAKKYNVELRLKEFLGDYGDEKIGNLLYPEAASGINLSRRVLCKNTVVPIAPDGNVYLCHSDLYFNRREKALGNILDEDFMFPKDFLPCDNYGLCNECDVKVKTNHNQEYGYTSVTIQPADDKPIPKLDFKDDFTGTFVKYSSGKFK